MLWQSLEHFLIKAVALEKKKKNPTALGSFIECGLYLISAKVHWGAPGPRRRY